MVTSGNKIRLLIVLPSLHQGGVERQVSYLYRHLDRNLFEVHLGYFKNRDLFYKELAADLEHTNLLGSGRKTSFDSFLDLVKLVKRLRPRILHLYTESANQLGALASLLAPVPLILFAVRTTRLPFRDHVLYRLLKRRAALTLVNSNGIRNELIARSGFREEEIRFLPNFLDSEFFRPFSQGERDRARRAFGWGPDELVIGSIGRISPQKNQQGAVRVLKILRDGGLLPKNLRFLFIGKRYQPQYDTRFRQMIQEEGLSELCEIKDPVEDMAELYNALDGVYQPVCYEGLSNVVIEAQSCGTPVALSREGDNDALMEPDKTGFSFSIRSDEETAQGLHNLIQLCRDSEKRERMGRSAREAVLKRFSLQEGIRKIQEIYLGLSEGGLRVRNPRRF